MTESHQPKSVPADLVMRLRRATDEPLMDCKLLLERLPPADRLPYVETAENRCGGGPLERMPTRRWREVDCPHCQRKTLQWRHGYDAEGRLWKGHECACQGWECMTCNRLLEQKNGCCR
jgi:hypothetical protein